MATIAEIHSSDPKNAPITTKNFLAYVDKKFYDGTIFHRVIPGFVDQGGGFTTDMQQKPTDAPIKNEASNGLHNVRGSISMARTSDPDSATSQFFLNLVDNTSAGQNNLDPGGVSPEGYAVFGKITKGLDVLDKIGPRSQRARSDSSSMFRQRTSRIVIISARSPQNKSRVSGGSSRNGRQQLRRPGQNSARFPSQGLETMEGNML